MHLDPAMASIVGALFLILALGVLLRFLNQPYVVAYLIAGVLIGPGVMGLFDDTEALARFGAVGVVLLLFFIGMEVSPRRLAANWKVSFVGTMLQIMVSVGCVWLVGTWLDWPFGRVLMLGFVISLSSTAVILKILGDWGELDTPVGQDALGILLVQDFAVVPMLIILDHVGGSGGEHSNIWLQVCGGIVILATLAYLSVREEIRLPMLNWLKQDEELQLFGALSICFGIALLTGWLGLSTALGSFLAGMIIGVARETRWVHHSLEPFRVVLVAIFFMSMGMMLDLQFVRENLGLILVLVLLILVVNTFINAAILRLLGDPWKETLYAGALLAQIGEFSFVLAAVGIHSHTITEYGYQLVISTIAVSLLFSPAWIMLMRRMLSLPAPRTRLSERS
ncbi:MAG: cation:proton antiporter [Gammaproteobacteria bacterium]|nr:cation:proton antiporter [Gammaproteobacteria bacterium]MDH3559868.1 cation:proton antiporter [Gammaproteobacteria bacterium]